MNPYEPSLITLNVIPPRAFRRGTLAPVLDALAADPLFAPETWSLSEGSAQPFDRERVLAAASARNEFFVMQLRRKKRVAHRAYVRLDSARPELSVEPPPKTPPRDWPHLFALADALATAAKPDIAWAHLFAETPRPPADEADATQLLIDAGVVGGSSLLYDYGPCGLGLRTYLGPRLVALAGRDLLLSTPAVVAETSWGGVRIDLVAEPWQASREELHAAWRAATEHLRAAGVFAVMTLRDDGAVSYERGARFNLWD